MSETEILGYSRHPASAVWPDLSDGEYAALIENIKVQGQDAPILATADKRVIDGWHRLRACAELDIAPRAVVCHFDERDIARKVIGAHAGRRHMTQIEIARLSIETMKAVGMDHAPASRPKKSDNSKGGQAEPLSGKTITRGAVAEQANVSESTARRAIREDKRKRGLAPAKTEEEKPRPDEGASTAPEAPSSPADAPPSPAGEEAADTATVGDPDCMETIRRALAQLQDLNPPSLVASLEPERIGEFYDLGQAVVDVGFAMVRAAGPHRTEEREPEPVPGSASGTPAANDGAFDIPPFLDRRGEGGERA